MATTKVELYNGATLVATKTSAPFTSIDWTPVTTGAATLTAKRYEDGVLVATSSVKNYTVEGVVSSTKLLDLYPDVNAAAYSLRLLKDNYAGSAIRVRRSSDQTEQDIGFSAGELDQTALTTFVGANDGFVTTWYDQSGNTMNAVQTTTTLQPKIVASGAVNMQNGKPTMIFSASRFVIPASKTFFSYLTDVGRHNIFSVVKHTSGLGSIYGNNSGTNVGVVGNFFYNSSGNSLQYVSAVTSAANMPGKFQGTVMTMGVQQLLTVEGDLTNGTFPDRVKVWVDGVAKTNTSTANGGTTSSAASYDMEIGGIGNGGFNLTGEVQEVVFFKADKSADRAAIDSNIKSFYSIA